MVKKRLSTRKHFRKHKKVHRTRKRNLHRRVKKTQRKIKRRTRRRRQRGGEASQASRRAPKLEPTNSYNVDKVNRNSDDQNFAKFCIGAPWKLTGATDEDPLRPTLEKAIEDANKDCQNDPPDPRILSEHWHSHLYKRPPLHARHLVPDINKWGDWKDMIPMNENEHTWLELDPNRGGRLFSLSAVAAPT